MGLRTREELIDVVALRIERQRGFGIDAATARKQARRIIEDLDESLLVAGPDPADADSGAA